MRGLLPMSVLLALSKASQEFDNEKVAGLVGPYPGYEGELKITGKVFMTGNENTVELSYVIGGLEHDATGGIHIHSGNSCDDADLVGGHYWDADLGEDPWNFSEWDSSFPGNGLAKGDFLIGNGLAYGYNDNLGRVVVIHNSAGDRVACALLDGGKIKRGEVQACLSTYPGYEGDVKVDGLATLVGDGPNNKLSWLLKTEAGIQDGQSGLVGIFSGSSCNDAANIGDGLGTAFWQAVDLENAGGVIAGEQEFNDGGIGEFGDVYGSVVIIADANGNRVACGVLNDCAKGSGEGLGSASGFGPGEPVQCKMLSPDNDPEGDDFCENQTGNKIELGQLGYNNKKKNKSCHDNVLTGRLKIEKKCTPVCCCFKKYKVLKSRKCRKMTNEELAALPKCSVNTKVGEKCEAGGERVPFGGIKWDVNNCGDGYDVYEVKCNARRVIAD